MTPDFPPQNFAAHRQGLVEFVDGTSPEERETRLQVMRWLDTLERWFGVSWLIERLLRRHLPSKGGCVMEVGVGVGGFLRYLGQAWPERQITGLDLHPDYVALAQDATRDLPNVTVRQGDAARLDPSDTGYDIAFSIFMVHHLEPEQVVALISEGLRAAKTVAVFDLWPWAGAKPFLAPTWFLSPRHLFGDAFISVDRAYTWKEWAEIFTAVEKQTGRKGRIFPTGPMFLWAEWPETERDE